MKRRGLTVIETLIASAVFTVAILALIGIYPVSAKAARQAQGALVAANLAEKELEFSRAMAYDAVADRTLDYEISIENNGFDMQLVFQTATTVTEIRPGLKQIKVRVDWAEPDSQPRKLEMETYVANLAP